ncbi:hypothetical protein [Sphingobacterium bambusae]|uniref:DUF4230 domain-containing protein n=1 Tax=Sphingobacterium bambusae TaxID=662858 RepID=A0ABW6BLY3_9SPHI|nr:hypothetical protein [Sphingobacterium bambusae]WPL48063.1 hypothetical protein SCB77_19105 [Sphingobacterium bambusae]
MKRKTILSKAVVIKIVAAIGLIVFWFLIRDYLVSGSNVMAERYEFKVSKDSLMKVITDFNNLQTGNGDDTIFKVDTANNPYFYKLLVFTPIYEERYLVLVPVGEREATELLLISVIDVKTDSVIGINRRPENKEEIRVRKMVIKNFEERVLDHLGIHYKHVGNAMNEVY